MASGVRVDSRVVKQVVAACEREKNVAAVARRFGLANSTVRSILDRHQREQGQQPKIAADLREEEMVPAASASDADEVPAQPVVVDSELDDQVIASLRRVPQTLAEIASRRGCSRGVALEWLDQLKSRGLNLLEAGDRFGIEKAPPMGDSARPSMVYQSRPDGTYLFGVCGDNHLGSKYERLDVLNFVYDRFAAEGVDLVLNPGNWIDGEASFNQYDLHTHGMDAQLRYLAEQFPKRDGIVTHAIAGDDHEGWYGQKSGVDIGKYAENKFREMGRDDWHYLSYMEAAISLKHRETAATSTLALVHPGGGSAYALSYSIQKIVESYEGGEKPAVGIYGHYHKLWCGNIRNVWTVQSGCTQDQTPFMRKKRLEAHIGGVLVKLKQDPETGAITEMTTTLLRYFNRAYYSGRWSKSGDVVLPERAL